MSQISESDSEPIVIEICGSLDMVSCHCKHLCLVCGTKNWFVEIYSADFFFSLSLEQLNRISTQSIARIFSLSLFHILKFPSVNHCSHLWFLPINKKLISIRNMAVSSNDFCWYHLKRVILVSVRVWGSVFSIGFCCFSSSLQFL